MQQIPLKHNYRLILIIFVGYLLPLFFLSIFSFFVLQWGSIWSIIPLGLILTSIGTGILYLQFLRHRNVTVEVVEHVSQPVDSQELENAHKKAAHAELEVSQLQSTLDNAMQRLQAIENERDSLRSTAEKSYQDYVSYRQDTQLLLEQNKTLLQEYQITIQEQREMLEKKQQHILQLDSKVHDLSYEIRALVQVESYEGMAMGGVGGSSKVIQHPVMNHPTEMFDSLLHHSPLEEVVLNKKASEESESSKLLQRAVDIAQKITGASYYHSSTGSRIRDLPSDHFAFDLRRLCESLRSENGGMILLFSQKEGKPLFVTDHVKEFTGWTVDKFLLNFSEVLAPSEKVWKEILQQMAFKNNVSTQLTLRCKNGSDSQFDAEIGLVPTGVFRNTVIVVFSEPA